MEEIKKQNSCDLIQTQNDEYEALLGLEKAKSEQAEMTKVVHLCFDFNDEIRQSAESAGLGQLSLKYERRKLGFLALNPRFFAETNDPC